MPENTSFDDAASGVYRGHRASKSYQDPKTMDYSPRKRQKMPEMTSFDNAASFVYRGGTGIEILPGPENRGV